MVKVFTKSGRRSREDTGNGFRSSRRGSAVKTVTADGLPVGAAGVNPGPLGQGGGEEIEGVPGGVLPGQGPAGRLPGQLRGLLGHGAVGHRLELHAVLVVKNDPRNAVGEILDRKSVV